MLVLLLGLMSDLQQYLCLLDTCAYWMRFIVPGPRLLLCTPPSLTILRELPVEFEGSQIVFNFTVLASVTVS